MCVWGLGYVYNVCVLYMSFMIMYDLCVCDVDMDGLDQCGGV